MNPNGSNSMFRSKKWLTFAITILANAGVAYLKTKYPSYNDVWIALMGSNTLAGASYILGESSIDAAAVKNSTPDTVVTQNVEAQPAAAAETITPLMATSVTDPAEEIAADSE